MESKDRRIARMSALRAAVEHTAAWKDPNVDETVRVAERFFGWIVEE